MDLATDETGLVLDVPYHDGQLQGLRVEPASCTLGFLDIEGRSWLIELRGVRLLQMFALSQGTTIASIQVVDGDALSDGRLALLGDNRAYGRWVFLLHGSYGADVVADCEDVAIRLERTT